MQRIAQFLLLVVWFASFFAETARCQEAEKKDSPAESKTVNWRRDYGEARKEAEKRKLPLFLVIVKKTNTPSHRYQLETLQNPKVVASLNEQYVTLLVCWETEADLCDRLGIADFPTTIIASTYGHILRTRIGFLDANALLELLLRAKAALPDFDERPELKQDPAKSSSIGRDPGSLALSVSLGISSADDPWCQEAEKKDSPAELNKVNWRRDYAEARKEAEKRKLPLFLLFITERRPGCLRYQQEISQSPNIVALLNEKYVPVFLDSFQEKALAASLGFFAVPATIIAGSDGTILSSRIGFVPADELMKLLQPSEKIPAEPKKKQEPAKSSSIQWHSNYVAARREAERRKLPMLVFFTKKKNAKNDPLDASTLADPTVAALVSKRFVALRVEGEDNELSKEIVSSYPAFALYDHIKLTAHGCVGWQTAPTFLKELQAFLDEPKQPLPTPARAPLQWLDPPLPKTDPFAG